MPRLTIRDAARTDIDGLIRLEASAFDSDRLSARSFRRLVGAPSAAMRVARQGGALAGYHLVFLRAGSDAARLYSVAVDKRARGRGVAKALLADAEAVALRRGRRALRLEVREDNAAAIRLYRRAGYRPIGRRSDYYADGGDALLYEKRLGREVSAAEDRSPRDSLRQPAYIDRVHRAKPAPPQSAAPSRRSPAEPAPPLFR